MEMKDSTDISTLQFFFVISSAQKCQNDTVCTQRRLNNIRDIFFILGIIKVRQILTGNLCMAGKVVIGTVSNTPQLAPAKGE